MSLFEIELNPNFKIVDSIVYLDEEKFKEYYKLNSFDDDITSYVNDSHLLYVNSDDFISKRGFIGRDSTNFEIIENYIKVQYDFSHHDSKKTTKLYPEWMLFYVAIKKVNYLFRLEKKFEKYIDLFRAIGDIRHKNYIIRNLRNFIHIQDIKRVEEYQAQLHRLFRSFLMDFDIELNKLFEYLNFLYQFHIELKENEKYKLMWNLETYILEVVQLLLFKGVDIKDVYLNVASNIRGTYSVMHEFYPYKPLYIEESKHYFESQVKKINELFNHNISSDDLIQKLTLEEKNEDILFSYLELTKRFNANKRNELVMGAMVKAIVLGIEEIIKSKLLTTKQFDKYLEQLTNHGDLFQSIRIKDGQYSNGNTLLNLLNKVITENEESLERYLAVYYSSRNYLAHYNIDMDKFFWGEDRQRIILINLIDSIIIILYKLSITSREDNQ